MINKPPPFHGLNIRIPIIILIKGRRFINQGSVVGEPVIVTSEEIILIHSPTSCKSGLGLRILNPKPKLAKH